MHGCQQQLRQLVQEINSASADLSDAVEIGVCPSHIHIGLVADLIKSGRIKLGAQDLYPEPEGAFTGEVSAKMLVDYGVSYVIVGHSERRGLFGETDQQVARKFKAAQMVGLVPILCIGETLAQREQGVTEETVLAQLDAVVESAGTESMQNAVIAYEPIWAIGTGKTATAAQAQEVHKAVRGHLAELSTDVATAIRIIYGGSVNSSNATELFGQPDIDGGLVGGASLKAEEFNSICKSADLETCKR